MTVQTIPSTESKRRLPAWITTDGLAAIGLLLMTVVLWLPFGFAIPFWADGWPMMGVVDRGIVLIDTIRPLLYIPYALAHLISPNLFLGLNVVFAATVFGKGIFLYLLLKRLTQHKALAFAAAALLVVFPADTAVFNEGTFSIHFALFCYVAAVYFLVAYWQDRRWYFLLLMGLGLALTTGIYETVYPLILFTPLLLVWQQKRISRRVIVVSALWYVVPLIFLGRIAYIAHRDQAALSYQSGLFTGVDPGQIFPTFLSVYRNHFLDGWHRYTSTLYPKHALIVAVIGGLICWWLFRQSARLSRNMLIILTLGGLAALALGYSAYFPTALRDGTGRTFFYSSIGGAVTMAVVFLAILQLIPFEVTFKVTMGVESAASHKVFLTAAPLLALKSVLYAVTVALFIYLGTEQLFYQHQDYLVAADVEQPVLRTLIAQAPLIQSNTLVLVIDETPNHNLTNVFVQASYYLESSLNLIYQIPGVSAAICDPQTDVPWGAFKEQCHLDDQQVTLSGRQEQNWTYDRVIAFRYHDDYTVTLMTSLAPDVANAQGYDPYKLIDTAAQPPPRYFSMLGGSP